MKLMRDRSIRLVVVLDFVSRYHQPSTLRLVGMDYYQNVKAGELDLDELDTVENVVGLRPRDPLNLFVEIWYQVFLWHLFSSIFVHVIAAGIAFSRLRRHKIGRFVPVGIIVMGFLSPVLGGTVTSASIAGVYRAAGFIMSPLHSIFFGVGQTIFVIIISFTRILATL